MLDKLEDIERRFVHIEDSLQNPQLSGEEYIRLTKERSQIEKIVETFRQYKTLVQQKQDAQELIDSDAGDSELVSLAKEELLEAEKSIEKLSYDLKILLLPTDPRDHKNVLLEIRAGTGGEEAALFASAFKKLPFSSEPNEYFVLASAPLTFLTSKDFNSSSVKSNTLTS